jgi:hypothetical protein
MAAREIFREGVFHFNGAVNRLNRCGITGQGLTYRYQVRLFAESLDQRGFIIDNRAINLYWNLKYSTPEPKVLPSCEEIAERACADFVELARLEGVDLLGCEVRVYGGSHSAVTARCGEGVWTTATRIEADDVLEPVIEDLSDSPDTYLHLQYVTGQATLSKANSYQLTAVTPRRRINSGGIGQRSHECDQVALFGGGEPKRVGRQCLSR